MRRFANESAAISLALSQVEAINTLARLTTTSPDPIQQRLAATTLLRAAQPRAARTTDHAPARPPHKTDILDNHSAAQADGQPHLQAQGLDGHSRRRSAAAPAAKRHPRTDHAETPYPEGALGAPHATDIAITLPPTSSPPTASSLFSPFLSAHSAFPSEDPDAELDLDLDDDLDHPLTPEETAQADAALEFFKSLKVPLSHPDIVNAIAEGRGNDLESIAAKIRAESPPAPP